MVIKIILVDDHELIRKGVETLLSGEKDIEIVASLSSGVSLLRSIEQLQPAVVLLDLQLAEESGLDYLFKIKQDFPEVKVIILSSNENIHNVGLLIKSGASGYIFKNAKTKELAHAIRSVYTQEKPYLAQEIARDLNKKTNEILHYNALTPRELDVLRLITKELTSQEIARELGLSNRTVEIYRLGLMQKLEAKNMVGMVKKAIMLGLVND